MATFITAAIDAFREDPVKATLLGLAGFKVASFLYKAGRFVHAHFLTGLPDLAASYGASAGGSAASSSFVVVTGATNEGIGYAFAQEFAAQGFSIALVGRGAKLERVREKLAGQYPDVEIRAIAVPDLGSVGGKDDPAIGSIVGALGDDDVAGIVHAAGMETASRKFTDSDLPWNRTVLCVNALCPALLTHALLPKMTGRVARGEAKKSALVFVGAGFGLRPTSHVTLYSASKSFVHYFGIGGGRVQRRAGRRHRAPAGRVDGHGAREARWPRHDHAQAVRPGHAAEARPVVHLPLVDQRVVGARGPVGDHEQLAGVDVRRPDEVYDHDAGGAEEGGGGGEAEEGGDAEGGGAEGGGAEGGGAEGGKEELPRGCTDRSSGGRRALRVQSIGEKGGKSGRGRQCNVSLGGTDY